MFRRYSLSTGFLASFNTSHIPSLLEIAENPYPVARLIFLSKIIMVIGRIDDLEWPEEM